MADIKLKNRSGTDVTYTGVKTIQVPKADGVEEFINPTGNINITDTQITDVRGKATAQVVDENLKAENIAKGVSVLGITGTHEGGGGGGGQVPFHEIKLLTVTGINWNSTAQDISATLTVDIDANDTVLGWVHFFSGGSNIYPTSNLGIVDGIPYHDPTITENEGIKTYSVTKSASSVQSYKGIGINAVMSLNRAGLFVEKIGERYVLKSTPDFKGLPICKYRIGSGTKALPPNALNTYFDDADFSASTFTTVPNYFLGDFSDKPNSVILPSTVETVYEYAFYNAKGLQTIDFSRAVSVPTLKSQGAFDYGYSDYVIKVPSALYDEWIAATNWADISSHIVAV